MTDGGSPDPTVEIVFGTAVIDDIDAFLASVREIGEETGAVVQAFDADLVVSEEALRLATRLAARAIDRGEAIARDPAVEVLLYAAGRRQIDRALQLGVSEGEVRAVAVVADFGAVSRAERSTADLPTAVDRVETLLSGGTDGSAADAWTVDENAIRELYGITDRELDATAGDLRDVVHERIALLDVEK